MPTKPWPSNRGNSQGRVFKRGLRLLRTFAGVLQEKIRIRAILKENTANYISLESLINENFGKNMNCRFLQFRKRKSQTTTKMTMCHSIELIGYQIQAHWQNNCTVLNTKDQTSKVCQHFSIFWLIIFLIKLSSSSSKEYAIRIALKIATGEILQISKISDKLLFHNI